MEVSIKTRLGPVELAHPVINASGTFDVLSADMVLEDDFFDRFPFSAYVTKTVTLKPRPGNLPPRLYETAAGLLNSIGLANGGIDAFIREDLPRLAQLPVPVIASVAGESTEDFGACAGKLEARPEVAAVELNVSCPNLELGGRALGLDPERTHRAVALARDACSKFLIVKLTPNVTDIIEVAAAAADAGADAISLINTVHGMALDRRTLRPVLGNITGGLSGPAIKPVAIRAVFLVSRALAGTPVIGMGGITSGQDALEFLAAGATAVAVGTASFRSPLAAAGIVTGLRELMQERGIGSVAELTGLAHS